MKLVDVVALSNTVCAKPIQAHLKYATEKNFVGRPINGYVAGVTDFALLTPKAAGDLCRVQNELLQQHQLGLIIYDAYRPKRAVQDFMQWSLQSPANAHELERKQKHYPNIEKTQLFTLGYVMEDSNHCYGNTVDVVLIDPATNQTLDMGARFDYMDTHSHLDADINIIGETAFNNRMILQQAMTKFGFEPYHEEFWHFSHGGSAGREFNQAVDIVISAELKGSK